MKMKLGAQSGRAFSLIEMLFAMTILGIVLGLTVAEFTAAITNFRFEDAHLDAETQARVAMARINDLTKMATPNIEDAACANSSISCSIIVPQTSGGTPTALNNTVDGNTAVSFYEVTNDLADIGHLSKSMKTDPSHQPEPSYNVVTVWYSPPNLLLECNETLTNFNTEPTPVTNPCQNGTAQTLIHNVDGGANVPFAVTPIGCDNNQLTCDATVQGIQIDLSVVNQATQSNGTTGSSTSGGFPEHAYVSNDIYFSSWRAFH